MKPARERAAPAVRGAATACWAVLMLTGHSLVHALAPLTPQLTPESRQALVMRLADAGMPEVGHHSVLLALGAVLGIEPQDQVHMYDLPYPHLPKVQARARPTSPGCAMVDLVAVHSTSGAPATVRLQGSYCLVGPALWQEGARATDAASASPR